MEFGKAVGTACGTFAITNIDAMFVLAVFFAEAATNASTTPLKITIGQYLGFSVIVLVSMIGFGVALVLPAEPIGFLGLLPILLGIWKGLHLVFPSNEETQHRHTGDRRVEGEGGLQRQGRWARFRSGGMRSIFKIAIVTIMNGGDNIGTYIPLFSQAKGAEIAVYVVVYYILLGIWILVAWLIMKQKHILRLAKKQARVVLPFLYVGLGTYIVLKSKCYPWAIEKIDKTVVANHGRVSMAVSTAVVMLTCIAAMLWFHWRKRAAQREASIHELEQTAEADRKEEVDSGSGNPYCQPTAQEIPLEEGQESGEDRSSSQAPGKPMPQGGKVLPDRNTCQSSELDSD